MKFKKLLREIQCWRRKHKKNNNKEIIDVIFRRNKLSDSGGLKAAIQIELSIMTA